MKGISIAIMTRRHCTFILPFLLVLYICCITAKDICSTDADCQVNQVCAYNKYCECDKTYLWQGHQCVRRYGQICIQQNECSSSEDPFLQCLRTNEGIKRCLCPRNHYLASHHITGKMKCISKHFQVNKMTPESNAKRAVSLQLVKKKSDHDHDHDHDHHDHGHDHSVSDSDSVR